MKIDWDKVKSIAGIIGVLFLVSMCSYAVYRSDRNAEEVHERTEYFKITDKDYKNTSGNIVTDDYQYVIYFIRYDENMKVIDCFHDLKRKAVSQYNYERLEVGKLYHKSEVNIKTYGYY